MKAIVYERYGEADVLHMSELPRPEPKADEVLVRVHATTVTAADWRARSLQMPRGFGFMGRLVFGLSRPRQPILGTELAGRVEAVGSKVTRFKAGDDVFAFTGAKMGCCAEFRCVSERSAIVAIPEGVSYEQAAALSFGGTTALSFLRRGKVTRGERVLLNGASGGVGTAFVQLAKHLGAHVTGVCSGANVELVRSLGADEVIDYQRTDVTAPGTKYDVVIDCVGNISYAQASTLLTANGRMLAIAAPLSELLLAPWVSLTSKRSLVVGPATENVEDLAAMATLTASGAYKPVIDSRFPMSEIVAAHRVVDSGRKRGNLVISLVA